tara:strand:- start:1379 stop:2311 length:933 start_codon:yes stop_codon:yes gene_type:complete
VTKIETLWRNVTTDQWDADVLSLALAIKKSRRDRKGDPYFNCYVWSPSTKLESLISILQTLRMWVKAKGGSYRFIILIPHQPLVVGATLHWSLLDVNFGFFGSDETGRESIFCFDSVGGLRATEFFYQLQEKLSDVNCYYYHCADAKLQADHDNCAIFTFDIACTLTKLDVHETLLQRFTKSKKLTVFTQLNFPVALARLLRSTQPKSTMLRYPKQLRNATSVVPKDPQMTLESYIKSRDSRYNQANPTCRYSNILYLRSKYKMLMLDALSKFQQPKQPEALLAGRSAQKYLCDAVNDLLADKENAFLSV